MKIKGKKITERNIVLVVFPRPEEPLVFKAGAIIDESEFDVLVKRPTPPMIQKPGKEPIADFEDADYRKLVDEWIIKKNNWFVITSLGATDGLEWEQVKQGDPDTWKLWREELKGAGLSRYEINRLVEATNEANSLDEDKLDEARKSFLRSQAVVASQ